MGRKVLSKDYNLAVIHPELVKEWNYEKNELGPECYTPGLHKKVFWVCEKNHEWLATISNRVYGRGCPYCSGRKVGYGNDLLFVNPKLCKEWNHKKNELGPENFTPNSNKKVWWVCEKSHEWQSVISTRSKGIGCPYCSGRKAGYGNDLLSKTPELAAEWNYKKNKLGPENFTPSSGKKVWWVCEKFHEWQSTINNRARGKDCPSCNESKGEKRVRKFLKSYNIKFKEQKTFDKCKDGSLLRFDFYIPLTSTLIEYQGEQHYRTIDNNFFGGPKALKARQRRDQIKRDFAKKYNFNLIEIPYTKFDTLESYLFEELNKIRPIEIPDIGDVEHKLPGIQLNLFSNYMQKTLQKIA